MHEFQHLLIQCRPAFVFCFFLLCNPGASMCFPPDRTTVINNCCDLFEMAPSVFPDLFKPVMSFSDQCRDLFTFIPIVEFVCESNRINQANGPRTVCSCYRSLSLWRSKRPRCKHTATDITILQSLNSSFITLYFFFLDPADLVIFSSSSSHHMTFKMYVNFHNCIIFCLNSNNKNA